ncbi:hypothetical protein [Nocardiopsis composta]|uniref:Uncharacterized protein n=1 Tax=Nocardiopsis composta TaxID=157465 RepID=A0A7W8VBX7_9ACTN|nr:hypothetical protein [Nocardiopsis composta]MBB5430841.1 hypothetical protein [Nocardiopsis composta]
MGVQVCSLISNDPQSIPGGGGYRLLKFRYAGESYDPWRMHDPEQPDGGRSAYPDDRSALIWPAAAGWGTLYANIHWAAGSYAELRDRFVRDPLGLSGGADSTATDHRPPSPGMQCFTKAHGIFVSPDTPLAVMVGHTGSGTATVVHAQFKLVIEAVAEP